ncbi:MAG: hypothetical protein AAF748_10945 [Pseudomonadota bacterium]
MFAAASRSPRIQKAIDWAVFAVGAAALSTAIVATVLGLGGQEYAQAQAVIVAPTS